jgi:Bacterial conjugation TrbI-like protein
MSMNAAHSGSRIRLFVALGLVAVLLLLRTGNTRPGAVAPAASSPTLPHRLEPQEPAEPPEGHSAPVVGEPYRREVTRPLPVQKPASAPETPRTSASEPGVAASHRRDEKRSLPELFRMPGDMAPAPSPSPAPRLPEPTGVVAPYGRLIKCELVGTVDSISARPEAVVAIVTEPLYWDGQLVVPEGSEVFGHAQPEPILDANGIGRLVDDGQWTLVLHPADGPGAELAVKARALDRREAPAAAGRAVTAWGMDDGTDGLVGYALTSMDGTQARLFAAAALQGATRAVTAIAQRQQAGPGLAGTLGATEVAPTLGNAAVGAAGGGASDSLGEWITRLRAEVARRGAYVRVPAGKTFYLFVEQTLDTRSSRRMPHPDGPPLPQS